MSQENTHLCLTDDCKNTAIYNEVDGRLTRCHTHQLDADTYRKTLVFIPKAKAKHGDKYGYWAVVYTRWCDKVKIYCKKCNKYFEQSPNKHLHPQGCKSCSKEKSKVTRKNNITFEMSFASHEKSKYWSNKNGEVQPRDISLSSSGKYWFDCDICNHSFDMTLSNINQGKWCSYCATPSRILCSDISCILCSDKSFASHPKSKFWSSKNGDVKPRDIFKVSSKKYWFDCDTCNHSFYSTVSNITNRDSWCPYCSNSMLCCNSNCNLCYNKSFATHSKSKFWSRKNGDLKPSDVSLSSSGKYWFDCDICKHTFDSILANITKGQWCPFCSEPSRILCSDISCILCYDKSFASHTKSKFWSRKNGDIKPRDVFKISGKKYWFDCDTCNHSFNTVLSSINSGIWCPFCFNKSICNNPECNLCYDKSFASHPKSKFWSIKNGDVKPRDVFKISGKKYWFDCDTCNNKFYTQLSRITKQNNWCPTCINKTEKKLFEILKQIYQSIQHQFKVEWCKNRRYLPFDFVIQEYKIIIELDGAQHFKQISNWQSPVETFKIDKYKMKCANDNGYSVIRILQEDVFNDTYDWKTELIEKINELSQQSHSTNVYMCKNNEYIHFQTMEIDDISVDDIDTDDYDSDESTDQDTSSI